MTDFIDLKLYHDRQPGTTAKEQTTGLSTESPRVSTHFFAVPSGMTPPLPTRTAPPSDPYPRRERGIPL